MSTPLGDVTSGDAMSPHRYWEVEFKFFQETLKIELGLPLQMEQKCVFIIGIQMMMDYYKNVVWREL
jgi:hypothetical protein